MDLNEFFGRPADYSEEFANRVAGLAEERSTVHLGPDGTATGDATEAWGEVKTAVSSRGSLYALLAYRKKPGTNEWLPVGASAAVREVAAEGVLAAIVGVMRAVGLEQVPEIDALTEQDALEEATVAGPGGWWLRVPTSLLRLCQHAQSNGAIIPPLGLPSAVVAGTDPEVSGFPEVCGRLWPVNGFRILGAVSTMDRGVPERARGHAPHAPFAPAER